MPAMRSEQVQTLRKLSPLGYALSEVYGDGVINATRESDGMMVFVRPDGSVTPPRTTQTMVADSEVRMTGLEMRR